MEISLLTLKLGPLGFWTLWYELLLMTDLLEGLKVMGMLLEQWKLVSRNYLAVFKHYDNQSQHLTLLIGRMATALSLYLLPA